MSRRPHPILSTVGIAGALLLVLGAALILVARVTNGSASVQAAVGKGTVVAGAKPTPESSATPIATPQGAAMPDAAQVAKIKQDLEQATRAYQESVLVMYKGKGVERKDLLRKYFSNRQGNLDRLLANVDRITGPDPLGADTPRIVGFELALDYKSIAVQGNDATVIMEIRYWYTQDTLQNNGKIVRTRAMHHQSSTVLLSLEEGTWRVVTSQSTAYPDDASFDSKSVEIVPT